MLAMISSCKTLKSKKKTLHDKWDGGSVEQVRGGVFLLYIFKIKIHIYTTPQREDLLLGLKHTLFFSHSLELDVFAFMLFGWF